MKKKIVSLITSVLLISFTGLFHSQAQSISSSILATTGINFSDSVFSSSSTAGDLAISTLAGGNVTLLQGFQQPIGCSSLTVPSAPSFVTQQLVSNICGQRVFRYTASSVSNATGYAWIIPSSLGGVGGVFVDSGDIHSSRTLLLRYVSNNSALTTDSIRIRAFHSCATSVLRSFKLTVNALVPPAAPANITITLVSNVCGARVYRYTAPALSSYTLSPLVTGYLWTMPFGPLGSNGVLDSGTLTSRSILIRYSSNAASAVGDSIRVRYISDYCGMGAARTVRLSNLILNPPPAPANIIMTLVSNVCGARVYRYTVPLLSVSPSVTGYLWTMPFGPLGSNGVLDSGTLTSRSILIRYTSNAASVVGDSIRVRYNSDYCGFGPNRTMRLNNTVLNPPAAPSVITSTLVSLACGSIVYRYTAPALSSYTSLPPVTGYLWTMPFGPLGSNGVLDSGTLTSRSILIRYTSNAGSSVGDSIRVRYNSDFCGLGAQRSIRLVNSALTPSSPNAVSVTKTLQSTCLQPRLRFRGPDLPIPTSVASPTGYEWSFTGLMGSSFIVDSGSLNSKVVILRFNSEMGTFIGDSVRLRYSSPCGFSSYLSFRINSFNTVENRAPMPISMQASIVMNNCGNRIYRYSAPPLPGAVANVASATGYLWTMPVGPLGSNGMLDSGTLSSRDIIVRYTSNAGATAGDSVSVRYNSACGYGRNFTAPLSNIELIGCSPSNNLPVVKSAVDDKSGMNPFSVIAYPNPGQGDLFLKILGATKERVVIQVFDMQGRIIKTTSLNPQPVVCLSSMKLPGGIYLMNVRQGKKSTIIKVVRD